MTAPTAEQVAAIAKGLTKAQREAVCGRWGWQSPWAAEDGESELERLGLWNPRPVRLRLAVLTPLGLAVRAHIIGASDHD